jgi:methylene-tetrahydromethanopterin dehydrogenase
MDRPFILHLFTPARQASPFDVNMAADAGYQLIVPYTDVALDGITALTQDAIFSRGPKGVARTGIFVGGRDALLAADMLARAQAAMFEPFVVSLMADPSGAYTTAAAMVACVESALKRHHHGAALAGQRVLVLGGTGPVGRIAAVLAAQAGARVAIASHSGLEPARKAAADTAQRFEVAIEGVSGAGREPLRAELAQADVVLACAAAGVQVVTADDLTVAKRLKVAADVNAVAPEGIAGVGVMDDAKPLAGVSGAVGIGALAVGNVKYQAQHRLLVRMRESDQALVLSFAEAFGAARAFLAEAAAKA